MNTLLHHAVISPAAGWTCIFTGASFEMVFTLPDVEMDANGDLKNVKVRKTKQSPLLNSSVLRTFATETTSCEASQGY